MLVFSLVFCAFSKCACVFGQSESLILVQDISHNQIHCVTSEIDRAVVWNTTLDENFINGAMVTFPNKTYETIEWGIENSIKSFFGPVLDSRWESFPMVMSSSPQFGNLKFTLLKKINEFDSFEIPISARIGRDAHIYICETSNQPFENSCYWFILGGWNGRKSVLRKCKINEISPKGDLPSGTCLKNIDEVDKNPLLGDRYVHFTIKFNSKSKSISIVIHGENKAFLTFVDRAYDENKNYESIWVNSRNFSVGFWRIHDYNFYIMRNFTSYKVLSTQLTSNVCISMYVTVCVDCSFTLVLMENNSEKIVDMKFYTFNKDSVWQKVFISYKGDKQYYNLFVNVSSPYKNMPYMALDKISMTNECPEKEIKYSTLTTNLANLSCGFLTGGGKIEPRQLSNIKELDLKCPFNTFGPDCISCSLLKNDCKSSKICEYQNHNEVCYCSAGFMNQKCETECPSGSFGLNCTEKCGHCAQSTCRSVDGYCPGKCNENFEGLYCNETINPILKEAPKLLEECYTTCRFSIDPGNYVGKHPPFYYQKYYLVNNGRWWKTGGDIDIHETQLTLTNLKISTPYSIKVILCSAAHKCYNDIVPKLDFTTICRELQESDIALNISTYSAAITISKRRMDNDNCPLNTYLLKVTEGSKEVYNKKLSSINYVSNLLPYQNYEYVISDTNNSTSITGMFTTNEDEPSEVTQVGFNITSDELIIQWNAPKDINGNILGYNVQLEHISYISCNNARSFRKIIEQINVTDTAVAFKDIYPYSTYSVSIRAINKYIGKAFKLSVASKESEKFNQDAYTVSTKAESTVVVINLYINCTLVYSPFVASFKLNCSEKYCLDPIHRWSNETVHSLRIASLAPYTEYSLFTRIFTKFETENQLQEVNFRTKPDVPYTVRKFEVYAMYKKGLLFRFLPPYPQTGVIEKYRLTVSTSGIFSTIQIFNGVIYPHRCEIWRWMLCLEITNLDYGTYYNIYISAKNEEVPNFSEFSHIGTYLQYASPDPPSNVKGAWDDFYNLTINWQHPDKSNGILTSFNIYVNNHFAHSYRIGKNNLTYYYKIQRPINIQNDVTYITINSENIDKLSSNYETYEIKNPPPKPSFKGSSMIMEQSNQTVTIEIPQVIDQIGTSYLYILVTKDKEKNDPQISVKQLDLIEEWIDLSKDESGWIAKGYSLNPQMESHVVVLGDGDRMFFRKTNESITNWNLQADTSFRIYFVALNERASFERRSVYSVIAKTSADDIITIIPPKEHNMLIYLLFLSLIIPIILLVIYVRKKKIRFTSFSSGRTSSRRTDTTTVQISDTIPLANTSGKSTRSIAEEHKVLSNYSRVVNISDFEEYVKESIFNGELIRQHALFAKGEQKPNDYGKLAENKGKNRYANLVSYNHSSVKLKKLPGDEYSDYINANYIKGLNCPKAYIATQGPKPNTVNDFWRMIWEENVANIVMLANVFENGKKKTEKYWPNYNEDMDFANINVRHVSTETFADYEIRDFIIKGADEERKIQQLHYTTWPDHGVPLYPQSLVPFLRRILTFSHGTKPVVVHCSAGVGRTGTIILIDLCLRMAAQMGYVDVLYHLYQLREQRTNMVDNIEQYNLAHLVILECLFSPDTAIDCNEHFEEAMKMVIDKELKKQMEYIERSAWQEDAISMTGEIRRRVYPEKDRFPGVPVENYGIMYLTPYPPSDESSTYINATAVDGFRSRKRFIATQNPLPSTLGDFWRLVVDNDASIIVSLQEIDHNDRTCCQFFPSQMVKVLNPTPIISIHHIKTENLEAYELVSVFLHYKGEQRKIKIIVLKEWKFGESCTSNRNALLSALQQMNQLSWNENRVIITCRDGISACGLYLAMCFTLEKIKLEQICDICQAVRVIRRSRRQFVQSEEQFIILHELAFLYLRDFELYANFGSRQ